MFDGYGSKNANNPANSILEIYDPNNTNKWRFINCNEDNYNYNYNYNYKIKFVNRGFTIKRNQKKSKEKGSLHLRLKK